ncbi:MAG: D-tyrosyl-tRNA(Tyr) deacylase [Sedimentisphaerales bacterium]|nr:D-tyrosyl-tRNA(Tyr) deacylase [Sedimentisphaerales bacterium]
MRVVLQRVTSATVEVEGEVVGKIGGGLLVYLGVGHNDERADAEFIAEKLVNLRIFTDEAGKMNLSVLDVGGEVLLVSQFTLYGDCRKGRRPGFDAAGEPGRANQLYEEVAGMIEARGVKVAKGVFAAHMHVSSCNDGPVTFMLDSGKLF